MKRYLTGYSKNTLTIRDRKTGQTKRVMNCDKETAEIVQSAIKGTNYNLNKSKNGRVEYKSFDEVQSWLNNVSSKKHRTEWGWILPEKINWVKDEPKEETKEQELIDRLNAILKGD